MMSTYVQSQMVRERAAVTLDRATREPFGKDSAGMDQAAALWFIGKQLERIADVMEEAHK